MAAGLILENDTLKCDVVGELRTTVLSTGTEFCWQSVS